MTKKDTSSHTIAVHADRMTMLGSLPDDALISINEFCSFINRSRPSTYRDIIAGKINPPLKFGRSSKYRLGYVRSLVRELKSGDVHGGANDE